MNLECPRCGGQLATYTLQRKEAVVCESCEYVNVPARHGASEDEDETESWDEALERYHRQN